jgi:hypothetical protein
VAESVTFFPAELAGRLEADGLAEIPNWRKTFISAQTGETVTHKPS